MIAILLSEDGFWIRRDTPSCPPTWSVPWMRAHTFAEPPESPQAMPSYGRSDFKRIALDPVHDIAVYVQETPRFGAHS